MLITKMYLSRSAGLLVNYFRPFSFNAYDSKIRSTNSFNFITKSIFSSKFIQLTPFNQKSLYKKNWYSSSSNPGFIDSSSINDDLTEMNGNSKDKIKPILPDQKILLETLGVESLYPRLSFSESFKILNFLPSAVHMFQHQDSWTMNDIISSTRPFPLSTYKEGPIIIESSSLTHPFLKETELLSEQLSNILGKDNEEDQKKLLENIKLTPSQISLLKSKLRELMRTLSVENHSNTSVEGILILPYHTLDQINFPLTDQNNSLMNKEILKEDKSDKSYQMTKVIKKRRLKMKKHKYKKRMKELKKNAK